MTRFLVLGATGRSGAAVLAELPPDAGVVAALRAPDDADRLPRARASVSTAVVDLDDLDSVRRAADGVEVIVNAVRLRGDIPRRALVDLHDRLVSAADAQAWIVTVGGAGSLHLPDGARFWRHPAFPERTLPRGIAHAHLRDHLESGRAGARWAYLIPPPAFDPDGPRTGHVETEGPSADESGFTGSQVSYADFAVATARAAVQRWAGTTLVGRHHPRPTPGARRP